MSIKFIKERREVRGRLHDHMKGGMEIKNLTVGTRDSYLPFTCNYVCHFGTSPEEIGGEYLHYLMKEKMAYQSTIS